MIKTSSSRLTLWKFDNLLRETDIDHFVTERNSSGDNSFTLSLSSTPDRMQVIANRTLLAQSMGVDSDRLFFPSQVHQTKIVRVTSSTSKDELAETDALITNERGICIAVMSADCVTILLYDRKNKAVGAVHSGWRGTVARILEKTLASMAHAFGTTGEDIIAGIGPSVCQDSYEVGEEVIADVNRSFGSDNNLLVHTKPGKAKLDLWQANIIQLKTFGVKDHQVEIADLCTVKNNDRFFSARRGDKGRFAAGILIR